MSKQSNAIDYIIAYKNNNVILFDFFSLSFDMKRQSTVKFLFDLIKNFKHQEIKFSDLPIRYSIVDEELLIFFIWFDSSLKEAISEEYDEWIKGFD